jgi:hypothetical protein
MDKANDSPQALSSQRPVNLVGAAVRMVTATALLELTQWWRLLRSLGRDLPANFRQSQRVLTAWADASARELPDDMRQVYGRIDDLIVDLFGDGTSEAIRPELSQGDGAQAAHSEESLPDAPPVSPRSE